MFNLINMEKYERSEHFRHYANDNNCTYSLTAEIDVTNLVAAIKSGGFKFYPTFIYLVTQCVNSVKEMRFGVDDEGRLGYYDEVSASYLIFHEDDKTFSSAYTPYNAEFGEFYRAITSDMERFKDIKGFEANASPRNSFPLSCLPWLSYTGLNLNVPYSPNFYAPIITWGKYKSVGEKLVLPLTVQINHAVADGYHISLFFGGLQENIDNFVEDFYNGNYN